MDQILEQDEKDKSEPVRLLHHFACTGGTLIAKCIASMPNTVVLSEVEPHSHLQYGESRFFPTDLIRLVRAASRELGEDLESEVFLAGLAAIRDHCRKSALRLILRDHAHSRYCTGPAVSPAPSLREVTQARYPSISVVTVRHPLDSFLSLTRNRWIHFEPGDIGEYAQRYVQFLDDHDELPLFRYEDFVADPEHVTRDICDRFELPFEPDFLTTFAAHKLSGDSGRSAPVISDRPRLPVPEQIETDKASSATYRELCARLDYEP